MNRMGGVLSDTRVVVTGASGGIGAVTARYLAGLGARVVLVARNLATLEAVRVTLPGGPHAAFSLDVTDEQAWRRLATRLEAEGPVHGVVTAAGMLGPIGAVGSWPLEQFRRTVDVNVVGTLLALVTLLPLLRATRGAVVGFAGGGATSPLPRFDAYAASKAALVRLLENIAVEVAPDDVRINCVSPGFVASDIHRETLAAGPELAGVDFYERTRRAMEGAGDPPEMAAELAAFLLSSDAEGITGRLISARWDPWKDPSFRERLRSDASLARLRRIDDQFFSASPNAHG